MQLIESVIVKIPGVPLERTTQPISESENRCGIKARQASFSATKFFDFTTTTFAAS